MSQGRGGSHMLQCDPTDCFCSLSSANRTYKNWDSGSHSKGTLPPFAPLTCTMELANLFTSKPVHSLPPTHAGPELP